ncbi:MAG: hypothetical protein HY735_21890 [Verrucomicrobia bacterium]|nr:hypothetical protein [Verrucomicrobiota bacterium]
MMTRLLYLTLLATMGLLAPLAAEKPSPTHYVQLVRGTDNEKPPETGAKAVGPKLTKRLQPVFRWKNYWEVNRVEVSLEPGKKSKVRLSKQHEVEIDLSTAGKRTVRFYQDGKLVSTSTHPSGETLTIQGENSSPDSAWFIVVRRDKPKE